MIRKVRILTRSEFNYVFLYESYLDNLIFDPSEMKLGKNVSQ